MPLNPGDSLQNGQFHILRAIGRGGFGFVYCAREQLTGETVAIKELSPALVGDPQTVKRFIQEARATQRLTHPNIVRTHHIFADGGNYYLVMAYLAGGSLADRLRHGPLAQDKALRVMGDVCAALSYAHGLGVVHCDLKPGNVLFDERGTAHLADFGIAHVSEDLMTRQMYTATGAVAGTIRYMAPEQLEGVRDDPRLDIYALGALLYEMLAGRPYLDFESETTPAAQMRNMQRIQQEPPVPLRAARPATPAWLAHIVERALSKAPADRFGAVDEMAAALTAQRALPVAAAAVLPQDAGQTQRAATRVPPPPAGIGVAGPTRRPSWFWAAVVGALILVLLIAAAVAALLAGRTGGDVGRTPEPSAAVEVQPGAETPALEPSPSASAQVIVESSATPRATETLAPTRTAQPADTARPADTAAPNPTDTPAPTSTPDPTHTPAPTSTPTPTATPTATQTPTPTPLPEMFFEVVYPLGDGLSMRTGPDVSNREITILYAGARLAVEGSAVRSGGLRWWPVSSNTHGEGWVAEVYGDWRLVKPVIAPGDTVVVANPTGSGTVPLRNQSCDIIRELRTGTSLTVIDGPTTRCDASGASMIEQGRRWWWVRTSDGGEGWVADFYSQRPKDVLVAPSWYVERGGG